MSLVESQGANEERSRLQYARGRKFENKNLLVTIIRTTWEGGTLLPIHSEGQEAGTSLDAAS